MKKQIIAACLAICAASAAYAADNDPVLLRVDGKDIHVSEFEYLYNKNNSQQMQRQSVDDYLQLFIDYKLKVADAEHSGAQDNPEVLKEYEQFKADLAAPYLRDVEMENKLVDQAYSHNLRDIFVSHIMVQNVPESQVRLDSIRNEILAGNITFEDAAAKYSLDRGSNQRGGKMGYVTPGRFPWPFEEAAYDLKVGEISPVINSGMGYHIIRLESEEPNEGQVLASHILRMTRGKSAQEAMAQKALIDSLYNVVKNGADFAEIATKFSEDPGSAKNGGSLDWFGRHMMVAEFDSVAFALKDGQISKPFETAFGYHIVKRFDHKGVPSKDEMREQILNQMKRDARGKMAQESFTTKLLAQYNATLNDKNLDKIEKIIADNGGYDSTVIARLTSMKLPVATYKGGKILICDIMHQVAATGSNDATNARNLIADAAQNRLRDDVMNMERTKLGLTNPDYRNLLNEYRDGILLYEIANRNVWDKASKDTNGLEKFFQQNISKYQWNQPKFKGYVIFASSDSLLNEVVKFADTLNEGVPAEFTKTIRDRFGRDIKIERVIAAKGENPITDFLAFGGPKDAADDKTSWTSYAAYKGRVIDSPEEASDVRGQAVTDYQAELEKEWVNALHNAYRVKVNQKVLDKVKEKYSKE